MNIPHNINTGKLTMKFIEAFLIDGHEGDAYSEIKSRLYAKGFSQADVISLLVEGKLYDNLDTFYQKHPEVK